MRFDELLAADRAHVWHPYASMPSPESPVVIDAASGVRLRLAQPIAGRTEVIDGMSSWWGTIHGYAHPVLDAALRDQLDRMSHVMFGGLTHEPAVRLASSLVAVTPGELEHVFFCDSGSVSVEVAIKMALQYWISQGRPAKRKLMTWRGGYHGDTFQAMSVCDPDGGMHAAWAQALPRQIFAPLPPPGFTVDLDESYATTLLELVDRHASELAAIIIEPIVQGPGGMRFHSPGYLQLLREATKNHDVLLIFDEVATGFGRTGVLFASEHAGITPDLMCVGKALTAGYMPLAATLCTSQVARGITSGTQPVLAHGPTFMGHALSCAVANASLSILGKGQWKSDVQRIEAGLQTGLAAASALDGVTDVRVLGAIGVVELDRLVNVPAATQAALARGVWLRPFRNLVYTMPPYVTDNDDLELISSAVRAACDASLAAPALEAVS